MLWNRTPSRSETLLKHAKRAPRTSIMAFDPGRFQSELKVGDVVVSMLPTTMQAGGAEICLSRGAHLITTCYVTPALKAYDDRAKAAGLSFINESGFYPGIDHVFAHQLVRDFKETPWGHEPVRVSFRSYCGGIPKDPGDFRYKFSWSPAGVIRELSLPSRFIKNGARATVNQAWEAVTPLTINGETFDVYPARDSLPYIAQYGFDSRWRLDTFVRGTLRPEGWKKAWTPVFERIPTLTSLQIDDWGQELWAQHRYVEGEQDRGVLYVGMEARSADNRESLWSQAYLLDDSRRRSFSTMAHLVSWPAVFAVEALEQGWVKPGVTGAPSDPVQTAHWMKNLNALGASIQVLKSGA